MDFRYRVFKIDSLSVLFCDNCENNHFNNEQINCVIMVKWWEAPEIRQKAVIAKEKAWTNFLRHFPKADKSRFISQAVLDEKHNATAEVFFKASKDLLQRVFGSDRQYWSAEMKQALGLGDCGGFPYQLSPLGSKVS